MLAILYADEYPVLRCAFRVSMPFLRALFQPAERNPCSRAEAKSDSSRSPESWPNVFDSSMTCGYIPFHQYASRKQACARANVGFSFTTFLHAMMASSYCRAQMWTYPAVMLMTGASGSSW